MTRIGIILGEHDTGAGATTRFDDINLGCVSMSSQDHIADAIENSVIEISRNLVKQL